jgi:hypothetical protein
MDEVVRAPFSSSSERPVNKKLKSTHPGPGTYIDINKPFHSSIKIKGSGAAQDDEMGDDS